MSFDFYMFDGTATNSFVVNELTMPSTDGTNGDVIATDGAGNLSLITPYWLTGPGSVTDEAIAVFDGISGSVLKESGATCNVAGQITSTGLINAGITYPVLDGTSGQFMVTDGAGNLGFSTPMLPSKMVGQQLTDQTTNMGVGDHVKFETDLVTVGSNISLDTSTAYTVTPNVDSIGRITLQPGQTYYLEWTGVILKLDRHNGQITVGWYDADSGSLLGTALTFNGAGGADPLYAGAHLDAAVTPVAATRYEVRFTALNNFISVVRSTVKVTQI